MFTQLLNHQLRLHGFRPQDRQALMLEGRLVTKRNHVTNGMIYTVTLDGKEIVNRFIVSFDVESISYTLVD